MNSIKYARDDRQGMVRLIVSEYERTVIIELTDNGSGVESENLTKILIQCIEQTLQEQRFRKAPV